MSIEIYAGFDESNHAANTKEKKGEIVTGVFSFDSKHNIPQLQKNCKDFSLINPLLLSNEIEYYFTILVDDNFKYYPSDKNLFMTSILLIDYFLKKRNLSNESLTLYLNFDGFFKEKYKKLLRNSFSSYKLIINNYTKKNKQNKLIKRPYMPNLIYFADVLANSLLKNSLESLLSSPLYVPFPNLSKTQDL